MEKAIKKAIKNGYPDIFPLMATIAGISFDNTVIKITLLDPGFWQNLFPENSPEPLCFIGLDEQKHYQTGDIAWLYYWHRFIDHLAEGKDIESFFTSLQKDL